MNSLIIKDLAVTTELDSRTMSAVRGGNSRSIFPPTTSLSSACRSSAQQLIGQTQNVFNENGNNVAFADDIGSSVKPVQKASNTNTLNVFGA